MAFSRRKQGLRTGLPRVFHIVLVMLTLVGAMGWEWSDLSSLVLGAASDSTMIPARVLSIQEISVLRVRDIKRRLARSHGFSAEELERVLDKKELIEALAFEEEKVRLSYEDAVKRELVYRGIIIAVVAVVVAMCWPLIRYAYQVGEVNFVVYTDRKRHEVRKCWELKSYKAMVGITLMLLIDLLQVWLTASIILSWVITSKYFFPVPSLPIRPAQLMGGEVARGPLKGYGLNAGPMAISWLMRFGHNKIEGWTGQALANALREQRKTSRDQETNEQRRARKAARKEAKLAEAAAKEADAISFSLYMHQQQQQHHQHRSEFARPTISQLPEDWMQPVEDQNIQISNVHSQAESWLQKDLASTPASIIGSTFVANRGAAPVPVSREHQEFLQELESSPSQLDELD